MTCAQCTQSVSENPRLVLRRVNKKGVPGIYLCQFCIAPDLPLSPEVEQIIRALEAE